VITYLDRDKSVSPISDWVDITFDSVDGIDYDIESSPSMTSPTWSLVGSTTGTGASTTFRDEGPVFAETYYRVVVQASGLSSVNEAGVVPSATIFGTATTPSNMAMVGTSLVSSAGTTVQEVVGFQLTTAQTLNPADSDQLRRWDVLSGTYTDLWLFDSGGYYPAYDGTWWEIGSGLSSLDLGPGKGFWAKTLRTYDQTVYFDGLVSDAEIPVDLVRRAAARTYNLIGQPLAVNAAMTEPATTFLADGAVGGMDPADTDQIQIWDQLNAVYKTLWLFDSGGYYPAYDGTWWEVGGSGPSSRQLQKGTGWWYITKDQTDVTWQWTEPVPY